MSSKPHPSEPHPSEPHPSQPPDAPKWWLQTRAKGTSPGGTLSFLTLRTLDIGLQYYLLRHGLASKLITNLGGTSLPTSGTTFTGLSPFYNTLVVLAAGSTAKQLYWLLGIRDNVFPTGFATIIAVYNTLLNSANTVLSVWDRTSSAPRTVQDASIKDLLLSPTIAVGLALWSGGLLIEGYAEYQRKKFKEDSENKGKVCDVGLWNWARNINYGGYTLFRAGYCMVAGGFGLATGVALFLGSDFYFRACPLMDHYLEGKYGDQFREWERRVRYCLLPGIV
ncbi:MAG: hypothetical protein M1820_002781 [Bogoriella megaspora]|nr:MAG: hypothetical protein M1820_002781 [Bogoriella megaspora]